MRQKTKVTDWFAYFAPRFYLLSLITGFVLRIALICLPMTSVAEISFWEWAKIFLLGPLNALAFASIAILPCFLVYSLTTPAKYDKPYGWILEGILLLSTAYFVFCNDITDEYGGPLPVAVNALMIFFLACFSLKLFIPRIRDAWRTGAVYFTIALYVFLLLINSLSECFFWWEFAVRYNFIAVDYLVYTNEVIGNIMESYPVVPLVSAVVALSVGVAWLLYFRKASFRGARITMTLRQWAVSAVLLIFAAFCSGVWLHIDYRHFRSETEFATQLQQNGCWDFLEAFVSNELDYTQFYTMLPEDEARAHQQALCGQDENGIQAIRDSLAPLPKNIVLITIESLSADFLEAYGNKDHITPTLDTLVRNSLAFDHLFATGNRTVRGLEAVTLCIPPSAGESIVKRKNNKNLFSTGKLLRDRGYTTRYFYGGDSYFDNMGDFFGGNGYEVVDKGVYRPEEITFYNIWGTCDEDSYAVALRYCDADYAAGTPFFAHLMTISNHRPYTYPDGRIQYKGDPQSRKAAVMYTDYALGQFLAEAAQRPWFDETVFVILADHCASSAGKTSLPLEGYHIPALIYAPGFIAPQRVDKICSQIDIIPTLLRLLHLSYDSAFYGQDILDPDFKQRAFMATYQDLGYYADGVLTVLSPVEKVKQYEVRPGQWSWEEVPMDTTDEAALRDAVAYYETVNIDHYKK